MDMKKTMNNKGYMLIEIVLAAALAFGIAAFIISLLIKFKNKNDDTLVDTVTTTDITIINNKIMEYAKLEREEFDCKELKLDNRTLTYRDNVIDIFNDYADLGEVDCRNTNGKISVSIPLSISQMPGEDYDIDINYKYVVGNLTYPYLKVETDEPTVYTKSKKANIIIGSSNGLLGGTYRVKYTWSKRNIPCDKIDDDNYVDIYVTDRQKEASLSKDKYINIGGETGKGKIYACNITSIPDYNKSNVLPVTIATEDAYLDNTPPTCLFTTNGVKVYFDSTTDDDSGVLEYGISLTENSPIYDKETSDSEEKQYDFGYYVTYYGYVKDKAGNEGTCAAMWTPPPPPPSSGGGGGGGGGEEGGNSGCPLCWHEDGHSSCC